MSVILTLSAPDGATSTLTLPDPPLTAPTGTAVDSLSDLVTLFAHGTFMRPQWLTPDFQAATTPFGAGFDFAISDTTDPTVWDAQMKCVLARLSGSVPMNTTQQWDFYVYMPTQNIVTSWNGGVVWEFHTNDSGHNVCIDNTGRGPGGKVSWRFDHASTKPLYPLHTGPNIVFDTWHHFTINVRWSEGTDGFYTLTLDDQVIINANGPTVVAADGPTPYLQFGFYADIGALQKPAVADAGTNLITIGGITYA